MDDGRFVWRGQARLDREWGPGLIDRFLAAAELSADALAGGAGWPEDGIGAGTPAGVVLETLAPLGVPVVGGDAGVVPMGAYHRPGTSGLPWIALEILEDDAPGNRAGRRRVATMALVADGQPLAGLVADAFAGRRWRAGVSRGAWVDGRPAQPRTCSPGSWVTPGQGSGADGIGDRAGALQPEAVPSPAAGALGLCRVADGSVGAFVHDSRAGAPGRALAAAVAVVRESGAWVIGPGGSFPLVAPEGTRPGRVVAAAEETLARHLLGGGRTDWRRSDWRRMVPSR